MEILIRDIVERFDQGTTELPRQGRWNFSVADRCRNAISLRIHTRHHTYPVRLVIDEFDQITFVDPCGDRYDSFHNFLDSKHLAFENFEGAEDVRVE